MAPIRIGSTGSNPLAQLTDWYSTRSYHPSPDGAAVVVAVAEADGRTVEVTGPTTAWDVVGVAVGEGVDIDERGVSVAAG